MNSQEKLETLENLGKIPKEFDWSKIKWERTQNYDEWYAEWKSKKPY